MSKFRSIVEGLKAPIKAVGDAVSSPFEALQKEDKLGPVLHAEVLAALKQVQSKHPDLKKVLDESAGFAVVPSIGRASLVLGGAYGLGEVFEGERVTGYAAIVELTIGVQVGGTTFHELVVFHDEGALKNFKQGKYAFAADASVEIVRAGAQASKGFGATSSIYVFDEGGMLLDLAIGGQKFIFKPAALGRARTAKGALEEGTAPKSGRQPQKAKKQTAKKQTAKKQTAKKQREPAAAGRAGAARKRTGT
jgi:lipid-binding SYLF domain-containing protein